MSLANQYRINYQIHPAFSDLREPMTLDESLMNSFNAKLGHSRERTSKVNVENSKKILNRIFESLRTQVLDEFERLFLNELEERVLKYIDHEFEFRRRLKPSTSFTGYGEQLKENAFFYSELSNSTLESILELAKPQLDVFRERASRGLLKRSDLSVNDGSVVSEISRILDKEFRSTGVFKIVSDYVGVSYSYTGLSLELSVAGSTWWKNTIDGVDAPRTMYAHLDETIYAPKAIVYLSPVTESNGPTTSYPKVYEELQTNTLQDIIGRVIGEVGNKPGSELSHHYSKSYHQSMGSKNFRKHFMMLPDSLKFNSHFGWDILTGSLLEDSIATREVLMLGNPGKFIAFDGSRLLHRGGLIEENERVVLQVVFWPKGSLREEIKRKLSQFVKSRLS